MTGPASIWVERAAGDRPRAQWVRFERSFSIAAPSSEAVIHLFACTRYRLRVNGRVIGYGPARFAAGLESYDRYDLREHLRIGDNVIDVEVCFIDSSNYQHMPGDRPRFVAWGKVRSGSTAIDLITPGDWRGCVDESARDPAPAYSFAIGPVEIRDTRPRPLPWRLPEIVPGAAPTGERPIPYPTGRTIRAEPLFTAAIDASERRIGGISVHPDSRDAHANPVRGQHFRYATFVHSSHPQSVPVSLHWGPHFLNGRRIVAVDDGHRGNCQTSSLELQEGWNLLCGEPEQLLPIYPLLIGLPDDRSLTIRSKPDFADAGSLRMIPPRTIAPAERWSDRPPTSVTELDLAHPAWRVVDAREPAPVPARMMAWDRLAEDTRTDRPAFPVTAPSGASEWTIVLDADTEYIGQVVIELDAPAGTIVDIGYDERLGGDGRLAWFASNPFVESADRFLCHGGTQTLETFHPRGGRYLQVTLRPAGGKQGVLVRDIRVRDARCLPLYDKSFVSDNPVLQWTWDTGLETLKASTEDVHCDSPWRERGSYLGDNYVQSLAELAVTSDRRMIVRCLKLFAASQRDDGQMQCVAPAWYQLPHGDFTLIYAMWLHDYWQETDDLQTVRDCIDAVDRLLASPTWQASRHSSLWDAPASNRLFIDWGVLMEARTLDENGVLNAFRVHATRCAAAMHEALGNRSEASRLRGVADDACDAFRRRLWLPGAGRFAGGTVDGVAWQVETLHVNILALAYGIASAEQEPSLAEYVLARLATNADRCLSGEQNGDFAELYFLKYALDALVRIDRHDVAIRVIHDHMSPMRDRGAPTLWECLHRGVHGRGSLCHSWSCAPMAYLARYAHLSCPLAEA